MDANVLATEKIALVGHIEPATITTAAYSDVIDFSKFFQLMGVASLGAINSGDQVVFAAYECDSTGNNASMLKAVTWNASTTNANSQIKLGIRAEDLANATYQHMKFGLSCGTTGGPAAVSVYGVDGRYGPESAYDLASVTVKN